MRSTLRITLLLGGLGLAACSGPTRTGWQTPAADAATNKAAGAPAAAAAAAPPPAASSAAAPAASAAATPAADPNSDAVIQARVDCWMKVEHQRNIRDIDRRIVFVDKCVADALKGKPYPQTRSQGRAEPQTRGGARE